MQDRFKFRYFNKFINKMVEPKNWQNVNVIYGCLEQQVCFDENIDSVSYDYIGNGLVFMQCTGLKDKNGKLIYEGDIVKDLIIPEIFYIVKWFNSGFYLESTISASFLKFNDTQQEVIGNIYEKPELLEEASNDN